jgi:hypothetical protein
LWIARSPARFETAVCRHQEARALLATAYDRFTNGLATVDLQAARIMPDVLAT